MYVFILCMHFDVTINSYIHVEFSCYNNVGWKQCFVVAILYAQILLFILKSTQVI